MELLIFSPPNKYKDIFTKTSEIRKKQLFEPLVPHITYLEDHHSHSNTSISEFAYLKEDQIVGAVRLNHRFKKEAFLEAMVVDNKKRKRGIGTFLVEVLEKVASFKGIEVVKLWATPNAIDFYLKLGYRYPKLKKEEKKSIDPSAVLLEKCPL